MLIKYFKFSLNICFFVCFYSSSATANINLSPGAAKTISLKKDIASVLISDPQIADYQIIDKRKIALYAKNIGRSSILAFDNEGSTIYNKSVIVRRDLKDIRLYLKGKYPKANVNIFNIEDRVVLTGTVTNEQDKDEINEIVGELLNKEKEVFSFEQNTSDEDYEIQFMERHKFKGIVNNIVVEATKQVNVKISIAEVSQSFLQQIGIQYGSNSNMAGVFVQPLTSFSSSDIMSVITAIGNDSIGQILAEPNLSVVSGESASFLVGGELPVVTSINNSTNVEYKEYGVRLELMAKVKKDDKILLSLIPEVSSLDAQYENQSYDIPSLKTRRARTTVELGDGQSFVLGGLLNSEDKESLQKIPFIGDIPILGALFRNSTTERNKTELIIVATVNLVKPIQSSKIQLPKIKRTNTLNRFFAIDRSYIQAGEEFSTEILKNGGFKK
ncbi:type II and III secretion system protein family protein [Aliivibrio fischeri]|uniref:type II and III secretion system protein family protein n=1 Tax=Aliivibrio fischeri TaxID=668 RepID=UPI00084C03A5|nr:type II and III secretion system protein family protein [Aliivibrio fischeri]OED58169.1 general secretion pathway protein GspD [Aliivibrio fischeri]